MENKTQTTAVAWLVAELLTNGNLRISLDGLNALANKALEMERMQIINAFLSGDNQQGYYLEPELYYEETYGE
jgi:hypothetical protein